MNRWGYVIAGAVFVGLGWLFLLVAPRRVRPVALIMFAVAAMVCVMGGALT